MSNSDRADYTLQVDGESPVVAPSADLLPPVVRRMTGDLRPGFLIVEHEGGGYAQAAGGADEFTVEWRDLREDGFTHWVAGRRDVADDGDTEVRTPEFEVAIRTHQRLDGDDVVTILSAFLAGEERPAAYDWADVSARFA